MTHFYRFASLLLFTLPALAQSPPRPEGSTLPTHADVFRGSPGAWIADYTEDYSYTLLGRLDTLTRTGGSNPLRERRTYNSLLHLTAVYQDQGTATDTLVQIEYQYDGLGRIDSAVGRRRVVNSRILRTQRFFYNPSQNVLDSVRDRIYVFSASDTLESGDRYLLSHDAAGNLTNRLVDHYDLRRQNGTWYRTSDLQELALAFGLKSYDPYKDFVVEPYEPRQRPFFFIRGRGLGPTVQGTRDSVIIEGADLGLQAFAFTRSQRGSNNNALQQTFSFNAEGDLVLSQTVQFNGLAPSYTLNDRFTHTYDAADNRTETIYQDLTGDSTTFRRWVYSGFEQPVVSVKGVGSDVVQLYPNPASGWVSVSGLPLGTACLVSDLAGRQVLSATLGATGRLELNGIQPGLYILRAGGRSARLLVR